MIKPRHHIACLPVALFAALFHPAHAQDTSSCDAGLPAFEDANGTVCVPEDAQRIGFIDTSIYELLLMLDRPPIAPQSEKVYQVGSYWYGQGFYSAHNAPDDLFRNIAKTETTISNPFSEN
jgi:hypothetical protein